MPHPLPLTTSCAKLCHTRCHVQEGMDDDAAYHTVCRWWLQVAAPSTPAGVSLLTLTGATANWPGGDYGKEAVLYSLRTRDMPQPMGAVTASVAAALLAGENRSSLVGGSVKVLSLNPQRVSGRPSRLVSIHQVAVMCGCIACCAVMLPGWP
jgi:hypothetical protein